MRTSIIPYVLLSFVHYGLASTGFSNIDCYQTTHNHNSSALKINTNLNICKTGFAKLPDDVLNEDEVQPMNGDIDNVVYCCPLDISPKERIKANKIILWPNELKNTLSRAFLACHASEIPGLDTIRFLLYTKKTMGLFDYHEIFTGEDSTLLNAGFISNGPVKIIIHGFMSSAFVGPAPALRAAYNSQPEKINIIVVHWEPLANLVTASGGICYDIAAQSTKLVGRKTASLIEFLVNRNHTSLEKVHVLGHSLGSHCAGFVGKFLKIGKLPRITAFDPAKPSFDKKPPSERLDFMDAEFVDVIHTATKQWKLLGTVTLGFLPFPVGIRTPMGHRDFYPNKGTHQPGCIFQLAKLPVLCSHSRSYAYYADSIKFRDTRIFLAEECKDLQELEKDSCFVSENAKRVIMGEYTPIKNDTRKIYLVKTNPKSPFPKDFKI